MSGNMRKIDGQQILVQILFWGVIWLSVPLLLSNWEVFDRTLNRGLLAFAGVSVVVAFNMGLLLPRLFFKKRYLLYFGAGLLMVVAVGLAMHWLDTELLSPPARSRRGGPRLEYARQLRLLGNMMPYLSAFLGSALIEIARYAAWREKEAVGLRNEKLEAEMRFLKSQINPHFLFNALNNIYTLTVIKSDEASGHLLRLSEMLRYVLYDCNAEKAPLRKEVAYLRDFVALARLKDSRGLDIRLDLEGEEEERLIAPMLFVPFVENAFKHSRVEKLGQGWIDIRLRVEEEAVVFEVANSVPGGPQPKDSTGGIGIQNVRRRLELLYPGRHELRLEEGPETYRVRLEIVW
jgi:hypothetical protein